MKHTGLTVAIALAAPTVAIAQSPDTLPARVAERQIDTFNRRDLAGFLALYADDAQVFEFPSGKVLAQGKPAVRQRYEATFKAGTTPPVRVEPRIVDGAFVVDNERWDAKPGERNQAVWMYEIQGGLIRKAWAVVMTATGGEKKP